MKVVLVACLLVCIAGSPVKKKSIFSIFDSFKNEITSNAYSVIGDPIIAQIVRTNLKKGKIALKDNKFKKNFIRFGNYLADHVKVGLVLNAKGDYTKILMRVFSKALRAGFKGSKIYKQIKKMYKYFSKNQDVQYILDDLSGHPKGIFDEMRRAVTYAFAPKKGKIQSKELRANEKEFDRGIKAIERIFQKPVVPKPIVVLAKSVTKYH